MYLHCLKSGEYKKSGTSVCGAKPLCVFFYLYVCESSSSLGSPNIWYQSFVAILSAAMALVPYGAGGSTVSLPVPMLTGDNYTVWAIKVEASLDAQGVWEAVVPA